MSLVHANAGGRAPCPISAALTTRQTDVASRLCDAALDGTLDLGSLQDCWEHLVRGSDAVPGLGWDDFAAGRAAAIRMIQARARRAPAAA